MAKIKKTKTVLKAQRDALARYNRYLPTLELKKTQLRLEVRRAEAAIEKKVEEREKTFNKVALWARIFADDVDLSDMIKLVGVEQDEENIAGVNIPLFQRAVFELTPVDYFETAPWVDDGLKALQELLSLDSEIILLKKAADLLSEELRVTSQRVNLFERVMIPDTKENIRVIKIALGDAQTAGVARAKTAKKKIIEKAGV